MIPALWGSIAILAGSLIILALVLKGVLHVIDSLLDGPDQETGPHFLEGDGLEVGELAPVIVGQTTDGRWFDASSLAGSAFVVLVVSMGCRSCDDLMNEILRVPSYEAWASAIVLSSTSDHNHRSRWLDETGRLTIVVDPDREWSTRFGTQVTPYVFVVGPDGRIAAKGVTKSVDGIKELLSAAHYRAASAGVGAEGGDSVEIPHP